MLIYPQGILEGERLAACTDEAQLHFARLVALGNGFGRMELNAKAILETAYANFHQRPSREQLTLWLQEYAKNHLLFIYTDAQDHPWGQWCGVPERMLPRFKTAADKRSPAPPTEALAAYEAKYASLKQSSGDFINVSEDFGNVPKSSEALETFPLGIGIGVGKGIGIGEEQKQILSSPLARATELEPDTDSSREAPELEFVLRQKADELSPEALAKSVGVTADAQSNAPSTIPHFDSEAGSVQKPSSGVGAEDREVVKRVFAYYLEELHKTPNQYKLTAMRMRKGLACLKECQRRVGGDELRAEEALGAAVDGLLENRWLMGANPQTKKYTDWETYVVKDVETMEKRWEDGGFKPDVHA